MEVYESIKRVNEEAAGSTRADLEELRKRRNELPKPAEDRDSEADDRGSDDPSDGEN